MPPANEPAAPRSRRGAAFALAAAGLFGASTPLAKGLLEGASPQMLAGVFYLGSGLALSLFLAVRPARSRREAPLGRRDLAWLGGAIACGGVIAPVLLLLGIAVTPASSASLLVNLEGVFTALLAWIVFRDHFDRSVALGFALIVLGSLALQWHGEASPAGLRGPLLIAAACLAWSVDNNLMQKVSAGDPVQIAAAKGVVAGALNTGLALALRQSWPQPALLGGGLLVGALCYGASFVLYVLALRSLGTSRTAGYFATAPFAGAALSVLLWHDPIAAPLVVASVLMAAGVLLHLREDHRHRHVHEAGSHEHSHVHDLHHQHAHGPHDPPGEPHSHVHAHERLEHAHPHAPDLHHRHDH